MSNALQNEAQAFAVLQNLASILAQNGIQLSGRSKDGRVNSSDNESEILSAITNLHIKKKLDVPGYTVSYDTPEARAWYDFSLEITSNTDGTSTWIPVNVKASNLSGADNLSAKIAIFYALTGVKPPFPESVNWTDFFETTADLMGSNEHADYYFLVVDKTAGKGKNRQVFAQSLKRLQTLTGNGSNLPFQCKWSENIAPKQRTFAEAKDFILSSLRDSIEKKEAQTQGFFTFFPDMAGDKNMAEPNPDTDTPFAEVISMKLPKEKIIYEKEVSSKFDVATLGQVFTPDNLVSKMLDMIKNRGKASWKCLEPSCGDGAFLRHIPGALGIEFDKRHCPPNAKNMDFFDLHDEEGFDTIIGNPPFVRFQDIHPDTKKKLDMKRFDERANLYMFFIDRCLSLLKPGGELIFVNPREFLKSTSAQKLNERLYAEGTITEIVDLGDERVFRGYAPNCVVWRFEKGNYTRKTSVERNFFVQDGQILFTKTKYPYKISDFFEVKVGAVSGADKLFLGKGKKKFIKDFVCSKTIDDGKTRKMIFAEFLDGAPKELVPFKEALLARKIKNFTDSNWWTWGRGLPADNGNPRVYVNGKTRRHYPFFVHDSPYFDGSVLALILKDKRIDPAKIALALNCVDWDELGFKSGGRFLFQQKSLENAPLPERFGEFKL